MTSQTGHVARILGIAMTKNETSEFDNLVKCYLDTSTGRLYHLFTIRPTIAQY